MSYKITLCLLILTCQTVSASELEVKTSNWEKSVTFLRLNTLKAVASNKPKFFSNLNFEFIGQGLVLEGTTEQRMVSFQKQNYRFNLIKENSNSKASLTTSLEGDSTALFDAVELDLNTLMTSETLSFQYGLNSKKQKKTNHHSCSAFQKESQTIIHQQR